MKAWLSIQYRRGIRKPRPLVPCSIDLDRKTRCAIACGEDQSIFAVMERAEVASISREGMMLSGIEEHPAPGGAMRYDYQEWWLLTDMEPARA